LGKKAGKRGNCVRQLVAGNWKMNGLGADLAELETVAAKIGGAACDVLVCPPATLLARAAAAARGALAVGGQDCHAQPSGAFTGDISAQMLKDAGASAVILGHSERRQYHHETDAMVAAKTQAAWRAGLTAIICIGETESQHDAGQAFSVCHHQILGSVPRDAVAANTAIAYEPIWAIGTGKTAGNDQIAAMHAHIRQCLEDHLGPLGRGIRLLYGGSVKPSNAREILALTAVDGALVGGASLKAVDFLAIIAAAKPC
jgi:triosephosphate isomerase